MTTMIAKSAQCWTAAESTAAISIIQGIGPQKYDSELGKRADVRLRERILAELGKTARRLGFRETHSVVGALGRGRRLGNGF